VPAAAVIPAPIAYIKVVAVEKLVVGLLDFGDGSPQGVYCLWSSSFRRRGVLLTGCVVDSKLLL
jgi:hypothetical protein